MSRKNFIIVLIVVFCFSVFTINFTATNSLAQNNKKGANSKIEETLKTLKEKMLNVSNKLIKKNQKNSSDKKNDTSASNPLPPVSTPLNESPKQIESLDNLQIIALYEGAYIEAVAKNIYPLLNESNFEYWDDTHAPVRPIFDAISERYRKLPPEEWPIIVMPSANYQAINSLIINEYPEPNGLNIVMPYINLSGALPNNYNTTGEYSIALVGGGYVLNDWTRGNKLDFIDSVNIQYLNPEPQINYDISSITTTGNSTRIYNSALSDHVRVGWLVWLQLQGSTGNIYQRYNITEVSQSEDYITINSPINIGNFVSGTAHVNYLSGTTAVVASKLKQIMNNVQCSFPQALEFARATASNQGIRNNETGYGIINVNAAINYGRKIMSNNPNFTNPPNASN